MDTKIARKDLPAYEVNPFASELILQVSPKSKNVAYAGRGSLVDTETGEAMGDMTVIGIRKTVDSARFIKIYEGGIKAAFDLKPSALKVFSKLLEAYRIDDRNYDDRIYFSHRIAQKDFDYTYSRQTFAAGITELITAKFIAEVTGDKGWFWINPAIFFKGDRLRVVNEYVVSKKKNLQEDLESRGQQRLPMEDE